VGPQGHLRMFALATIAWSAFWALGWPSYYQQYSSTFMFWFDAILLVALVPLVIRVLRRVRRGRRMIVAGWIAFYFTVPLFAYDWLYCGIFLGHGWAFLHRYWYVTVFYPIPWILVPSLAAYVNGQDHAFRDEHAA